MKNYHFGTITHGLEPLEDAVTDFHKAFEQPVGDLAAPAGLSSERLRLRLSMLKEEVDELELSQFGKRPLVDAVDACADLIYLAIGTLVEMGVEPGLVLEEVHRSNMSKLGLDGRPIYRADGKVLKGPNYEPPDIAGVLDAQMDWHSLPAGSNLPSGSGDNDPWGEGETLF